MNGELITYLQLMIIEINARNISNWQEIHLSNDKKSDRSSEKVKKEKQGNIHEKEPIINFYIKTEFKNYFLGILNFTTTI